MAKQIGSNTFKGTVDGFSFYRNRLHGYLVRRTGGVTAKQYRTEEKYAAARDASSEFAGISAAGKLIRNALSPFIDPVKDGTMVNRLNKELVALKQLDNTHPRGKRRPETKMTDSKVNQWFRIFQFNEKANLYEILNRRHVINRMPTDIVIRLQPAYFPEVATHAALTLVRTVIDFGKKEFKTTSSQAHFVSKENHGEILLSAPNLSPRKGMEITCLQVIFFKEKDGKLTQLKEKVHAMGIIAVNESQKQIIHRRRTHTHPHMYSNYRSVCQKETKQSPIFNTQFTIESTLLNSG